MISLPLLKQTIKSNYKIVLVFLAVLFLYMTMIIYMYDPDSNSMEQYMESLPQGMLSAVGFHITNIGLDGFLASYYYGFLILLFPMIYDIITANRLVAQQVDKGTMAYILSNPVTRKQTICTQALFLIGSITFIMVLVTVWGLLLAENLFPGEMDSAVYLKLNLGALLLHYAISSICFLASCLFNEAKNSLAFGAGIPIAFLLLQMLSNIGGDLENFKYVTMYTLYNPSNISDGSEPLFLPFLALGLIAVVLYIISLTIFDKKDLPL
ncbi:MAG: ABC transporter permease subunit [Bacillus sp. (in: firmicutes)]